MKQTFSSKGFKRGLLSFNKCQLGLKKLSSLDTFTDLKNISLFVVSKTPSKLICLLIALLTASAPQGGEGSKTNLLK